MAVLVVLGVLAVSAAGSMQPQMLGNVWARVDEQRLAADLRLARRMAINTRDPHAVFFTSQRGVTSYAIYRQRSGKWESAAQPRTFPADVEVRTIPSRLQPEFTAEGTLVMAGSVEVSGPNRTWVLSLALATGGVVVTEKAR